MNIREYDIVALTENVAAQHKQSNLPIILKRGQVGTVLMDFNQEAYLVDFADSHGNTYAMETISTNLLMKLIYEPSEVYA